MLISNNISSKTKAVSVRAGQNSTLKPLVYTLTEGREIACHDPNDNTMPDRIYAPEELAINTIRLWQQLSQQSAETDRHLANSAGGIILDLIDLITYIIKPALQSKKELFKNIPIISDNRWSKLNNIEIQKVLQ